MIGSTGARWLLTIVFAAAALLACTAEMGVAGGWAGPARRESAGPRRDQLAVAGFCLAMCGALIFMAWIAEPAVATWVQVAGFGAAGLWFVFAGRGPANTGWRPSPIGLFHGLVAAAMIWMLTALPGAAQMAAPMNGGTMAGMSAGTVSGPVLVISSLVAIGCAAAAIPWLIRSFGPGLRFSNPAAAGQAAMSAGMAAMLFLMV